MIRRARLPIRGLAVATASVLGLVLTGQVIFPSPASAQPPSNDDIQNATIVTSVPFSDSSSTMEATRQEGEPTSCGEGGTVWYAFTATSDAYLEGNTLGSDFDTMLGLYTGSPGDLSEIACNDDSQYGLASAVAFQASAGTTYYFQVAGYSGATGSVVFNVGEVQPLTEVSVTSIQGSVTRSGEVTLTGLVSCDVAGWVDIYVEARQGNRRFFAVGGNGTGVACGSEPAEWTMTFSSGTGVQFLPGWVTVTYSAYAYNGYGSASDEATARLRLPQRG